MNEDKRRYVKLLAASLGIEGDVQVDTFTSGPRAQIADRVGLGETEEHSLLLLEHDLREEVLAKWCAASEKLQEAQAEFQKYDMALCGEDPNG